MNKSAARLDTAAFTGGVFFHWNPIGGLMELGFEVRDQLDEFLAFMERAWKKFLASVQADMDFFDFVYHEVMVI